MAYNHFNIDSTILRWISSMPLNRRILYELGDTCDLQMLVRAALKKASSSKYGQKSLQYYATVVNVDGVGILVRRNSPIYLKLSENGCNSMRLSINFLAI